MRLTQSEVLQVRDGGIVEEAIQFPDSRKISYAIESSPASVAPAAFYSENSIVVRLPESVVLGWASSEQVSIRGEQLLDDGETLSLLIEKDFACLVPREGEDESDMFANPDKDSAC